MTDPRDAAAELAAHVAAEHAAAVDRDSRFPHEAMAVLRKGELLSSLIPARFGGHERSLAHAAAICHMLARGCASTGMTYAMHQVQVACIVNHSAANEWYHHLMRRISAEQLLIASVTSEVGTGGKINASVCAIESDGVQFHLEKQATSISYGRAADGLLLTARRGPDAPPSDQVMVAVLHGDFTLEKTSEWDALGMRGTCTEGFVVRAAGGAHQILPEPFADIIEQTMLPASHLLWCSVWLGIANDAMARAREHVRKQTRAAPGGSGAAGRRLAEGHGLLELVSSRLTAGLKAYDEAMAAGRRPLPMSFTADMNNLKTTASELCLDAVHQAFRICGINAYRNDTDHSLGRHLRDLMSAPLMINNDRMQENTANLLMMTKPSQRML